jgi:hypothetical protein
MPLLFPCGSLQRQDVQLSTFGRRLDGESDEIPAFGQSLVRIEDPGAGVSSTFVSWRAHACAAHHSTLPAIRQ